MSTRRPFSTLLPFIGAAVVTAGAVLIQIARRPAGETATQHARPLVRTAARPAVPHGSLGSGNGGPPALDDDSLLKRLRERGL